MRLYQIEDDDEHFVVCTTISCAAQHFQFFKSRKPIKPLVFGAGVKLTPPRRAENLTRPKTLELNVSEDEQSSN